MINETENYQKIINIFSKIKNQKTVIIGIGNQIKSDDGIGCKIIEELKNYQNENYYFINVEENPENYIGKIISIKPEFLLLFDAVDLSKKPGEFKIINYEELAESGFSTHNISLRYFLNTLFYELSNLKIFIIGIQPKTINYSLELSRELEEVKNYFVMIFKKELFENNKTNSTNL
ncbi:MAG TPA: hydrogenase maturation protease [bacterium]|nr:hydrogenase maturation protease [bacterium]HOL47532.1 hydrogenase maturation protease [bacterium]HPQ19116.1 hydrogenase maturation protease [bacterium]